MNICKIWDSDCNKHMVTILLSDVVYTREQKFMKFA